MTNQISTGGGIDLAVLNRSANDFGATGEFLKFSARDMAGSGWICGEDPVGEDEIFVADLWVDGRTGYLERCKGEVGNFVSGPIDNPPKRSDLRTTLDGREEFGVTDFWSIKLTGMSGSLKGKTYEFRSTTWGGKLLYSAFIRKLTLQATEDPTRVIAVLKLTSGGKRKSDSGMLRNPEFNILGWDDADLSRCKKKFGAAEKPIKAIEEGVEVPARTRTIKAPDEGNFIEEKVEVPARTRTIKAPDKAAFVDEDIPF